MGGKPRPPRWPTSAVVEHREWTIKYLTPKQLTDPGEDCHEAGYCDITKYEIGIDKTQADAAMQDCIYHELAHAIFRGQPIPGKYEHYEEPIVCLMVRWLKDLEAAGLVELKIK